MFCFHYITYIQPVLFSHIGFPNFQSFNITMFIQPEVFYHTNCEQQSHVYITLSLLLFPLSVSYERHKKTVQFQYCGEVQLRNVKRKNHIVDSGLSFLDSRCSDRQHFPRCNSTTNFYKSRVYLFTAIHICFPKENRTFHSTKTDNTFSEHHNFTSRYTAYSPDNVYVDHTTI